MHIHLRQGHSHARRGENGKGHDIALRRPGCSHIGQHAQGAEPLQERRQLHRRAAIRGRPMAAMGILAGRTPEARLHLLCRGRDRLYRNRI